MGMSRGAQDLFISVSRLTVSLLKLTVPAGDVAKVEQFKGLVASETLATSFEVVAGAEGSELAVEVAKA